MPSTIQGLPAEVLCQQWQPGKYIQKGCNTRYRGLSWAQNQYWYSLRSSRPRSGAEHWAQLRYSASAPAQG